MDNVDIEDAKLSHLSDADLPPANWYFQNPRELFCVVSKDLQFLMVNPTWTAVTGWTREELLALKISELIDNESQASITPADHTSIHDEYRSVALRLRRRSGDWILLEGHLRRRLNGDVVGTLRDVTANYETLQRERRERSHLSQAAGVGAWRFDPRSKNIIWSDEWLGILQKHDITMRNESDLVSVGHPDDLARIQQVIGAAATLGQLGSYTHRLRKADGSWMWARAHVRPEPLDNGQYLVHGISQDITELVEAREAAIKNEQQSRRLIEEAPFAVAQFDRDLRYASVSPSWAETFNLAGLDFMGKRLDELAPETYRAFTEVQQRALAGEGTSASEQRTVDSRGCVRWLNWETRPWRDGAGDIIGVVVYVNDVSLTADTRRAAETLAQRLNVALDAAEAAVIEIDYEERSLWQSSRLQTTLGRSLSFDEARRAVWPFVHEDDAPNVEAAVRSWLSGAAPAPLEVRIRRIDGEERWIRIYTEIERGRQQRWRRTISLLVDVDERKRGELALVAAEKAAHAAAEAKSAFLANMSHEIRTPMNGVLGILHLLQKRPLAADDAALVSEALACGGMLQALLDNVVDISKLEAGRADLATEPLDPRAILGGVTSLIGPQIEAKGLSLNAEAGDLPDWVTGDPVRIRQCLFNLVGNAVKFTERGSVGVRALIRETPNGLKLRYEVVDTGIGIARDAQEGLFQRFQQADASTTRRFGGSGLGLAITRELAQQMGGGAGFSSTLGEGSTFWFEVAVTIAAEPVREETQIEGILDGLTILIVEDNATNRLVATRMLESLGAVVETANDGEQGVVAAGRGQYDLILMDIQMPGIDGIEATRRIRALSGPIGQVPIIALTANVLAHQQQAYLAAGMNGVVGKPISPNALLLEIARLAEADDAPKALTG